jgi:hypothetical protein
MYQSSMKGRRQDEWSEFVLLVMKTSLSTAHELGLSPEAVLDCAARHLHFHDFTYFASAMQGAARAHACCLRRDAISPVEVAYIKTLAARLDSSRNALAYVPTVSAVDLRDCVGAPVQAYEKVAAAIQALREDLLRAFSLESGALSDAAREGASRFARSLATLSPSDNSAVGFERAFAAVVYVRFNVPLHAALGDAGQSQRQTAVVGHLTPMRRSYAVVG